MPHLLQERADEGHRTDFHLRNKPVGDTQTEHQRQHVEITRVIRRIDFCTRRFHMLLADDAHRASYECEQDLESGRGEASRLLVILDKFHYRPGRNNPQEKHHTEIQTVNNLETALDAGKNLAAEVVKEAPLYSAHVLQPGRRPGGGKSPRKIELF